MKYNKKEVMLLILLSLCSFCIPTILINTMNLGAALVPEVRVNSEWYYNFDWAPVTASIYLSKVVCYTLGIYYLYKSALLIIKK